MPVHWKGRPFSVFKKSFFATIAFALVLAVVVGCRTAGRPAVLLIPTVTSTLVDLVFSPGSQNPVRPGAKTTMVTATAVTYTSIENVTTMTEGSAGLTRTSPRQDYENKLAAFDAYVYAYNMPSDNDFHLIIGDTATPAGNTHLINIEISGRPNNTTDTAFKAVRQDFINILASKSLNFPTAGYQCVNSATPIHLTVHGGPFRDIGHSNTSTTKCGGLATPNNWEIHPVNSIVLK
jgi:hypothetical protein